MSDDLLYKLKHPPTMSMALNYSDLYRQMARIMLEAHGAITLLKMQVEQARIEGAKIMQESAAEIARPKSKPKMKDGGKMRGTYTSEEAKGSYSRALSIEKNIRALDPAHVVKGDTDEN